MTDDLQNSASATIGGLSARMDTVEEQLAQMNKDIASVLAILNQARGGWRIILGFCAFVGGLFAILGAVSAIVDLTLKHIK